MLVVVDGDCVGVQEVREGCVGVRKDCEGGVDRGGDVCYGDLYRLLDDHP